MLLDNFLRSQFGSPSGLVGSVFMGPLLNAANMRLMRRTIDLLEPTSADRLLDVGFGGGYSLLELARRSPNGRINGVDYSQPMVERARALVRERQLESLVRVRQGDVAKLPFRARTFDRVLTVNSIYYWPDINAGFRETARVLKTGGRIAVGFRSGMSLRPFTWTWEHFWLYEPDQIAGILRSVGYRVVQVEHSDRWRIPDMVVVVGEKNGTRQ